MKKNIALTLFMLALISCGGTLTDDQRKKIREDMEQHKIVKVTDAEITEAAFAQGRKVMTTLKKKNASTYSLDSLSKSSHAKIKWLVPGAGNALEIEKQLIDAYLASSIDGGMEDNIQRLDSDSLLYTQPVTEKMPDGSETVKGMWSIRLSKKQLILGMHK
jgi:hypothetical protein